MNRPDRFADSGASRSEPKAENDPAGEGQTLSIRAHPKAVERDVRQHLLGIARCPMLAATLQHATPCSAVVAFQTERSPEPVQVPTPWLGRLDEAPILFIGANPSIGFNEDYPRWGTSDDDMVVDAFQFAFESPHQWVKDGTKQRLADNTHSNAVAFWSQVKGRAREILGRQPLPGVAYAITEIVRCRSQHETGVAQAVDECADRWLDETLRLSPARVLVILGRNAARAFARRYEVPSEGAFEASVAGNQRMVVCLPHPAAWGPKTISSALGDGALLRIREYLTDSPIT